MPATKKGTRDTLRAAADNVARQKTKSKTVVAPKKAVIAGQPHMLAYINKDERRLLKALGGADIPGPAGIRSFPPANAGGGGTKGGKTGGGSSGNKGGTVSVSTPAGTRSVSAGSTAAGVKASGAAQAVSSAPRASAPAASPSKSSGTTSSNNDRDRQGGSNTASSNDRDRQGGSNTAAAAAAAAKAASDKAAADKAAADKAAADKAAAEKAVRDKLSAAEKAARDARDAIAAATEAAAKAKAAADQKAKEQAAQTVTVATPAGPRDVAAGSTAAGATASPAATAVSAAPKSSDTTSTAATRDTYKAGDIVSKAMSEVFGLEEGTELSATDALRGNLAVGTRTPAGVRAVSPTSSTAQLTTTPSSLAQMTGVTGAPRPEAPVSLGSVQPAKPSSATPVSDPFQLSTVTTNCNSE